MSSCLGFQSDGSSELQEQQLGASATSEQWGIYPSLLLTVFLPQLWWFLVPGAAVTSGAALGMAQTPPRGDGGDSQSLFLHGG